jgi:hypothetical protein
MIIRKKFMKKFINFNGVNMKNCIIILGIFLTSCSVLTNVKVYNATKLKHKLSYWQYTNLRKEEKKENFYKKYRLFPDPDSYIKIRITNSLEEFIEYRNFCIEKETCNYVGFYEYINNKDIFKQTSRENILTCYEMENYYNNFKKKYTTEYEIIQKKNKENISNNRIKLKTIIENELNRITYTKHNIDLNSMFRDDKFYNNQFNYRDITYLDIVSDGVNINVVKDGKLIYSFPMKDYFLQDDISYETKKLIDQKTEKDLENKFGKSPVNKCKNIGIIALF